MPYSVSNPPSKTRTLTAKGKRQFVHVMNSALEKGDDEATAHKKAWGAVRTAGNRKDQTKEASLQERMCRFGERLQKMAQSAAGPSFGQMFGFESPTAGNVNVPKPQGNPQMTPQMSRPASAGGFGPMTGVDAEGYPAAAPQPAASQPAASQPVTSQPGASGQGNSWMDTIQKYAPWGLMTGGGLGLMHAFGQNPEERSWMDWLLPIAALLGGGYMMNNQNQPASGSAPAGTEMIRV